MEKEKRHCFGSRYLVVIVGKPRHLVREDNNIFKLMLSYGRLVGPGISSFGSECK